MDTNEILDSNVFDSQPITFKEHSLAGQGKRFANYLIDLIIIYILVFLVGTLYFIILEADDMSRLTSYLIFFAVHLCYYITIESTTGKSIGKMITRTRVLTVDFEKPEFGTIVKRSLCRIIPFEQLSFLGSTGLHDSISNTVVVED